jgi:hypothetical protein
MILKKKVRKGLLCKDKKLSYIHVSPTKHLKVFSRRMAVQIKAVPTFWCHHEAWT